MCAYISDEASLPLESHKRLLIGIELSRRPAQRRGFLFSLDILALRFRRGDIFAFFIVVFAGKETCSFIRCFKQYLPESTS